jgi:hypothetical protein
MNTATHDWNFGSDVELWEFGGGGSWDAADGDPVIGCLDASRAFGASFDYGANGFGSNLPNTWDFLVIPHYGHIRQIRVTCYWRAMDTSGPATYRLSMTVTPDGATNWDVISDSQDVTSAPTGWFHASGESAAMDVTYGATKYLGLLGIVHTSVDAKLDTVHLEVDWDGDDPSPHPQLYAESLLPTLCVDTLP